MIAAVCLSISSFFLGARVNSGTNYDYVREFKRSTGTWQRTKPLFPSDLRRTGCAALRIANCKLFRLQLQQGLFRIRVPSPWSVRRQWRRLEEFCAVHHNIALYKGKAEKLQLKLTLYAVLWYGNCFCFKCFKSLSLSSFFGNK